MSLDFVLHCDSKTVRASKIDIIKAYDLKFNADTKTEIKLHISTTKYPKRNAETKEFSFRIKIEKLLSCLLFV